MDVFNPSSAVSVIQSAAPLIVGIIVALILISIIGGVSYLVIRVMTR